MTDLISSTAATVAEDTAGGFLSSFGIYIALALIVGALALGFYAGRTLDKAEQESALESEIEKRTTAENKYNLADQQNQRLIAAQDRKDKQQTAEVTSEVKKPAYSCNIPSSGIKLLNSN